MSLINEALKKAQRAWIDYRDGHCDGMGYEAVGGSMQPMLISGCQARLTEHRTKELRELIDAGEWDAIEEQFLDKIPTWKGKFLLLSAGELVLDRTRFEKEVELLYADRRLDMAAGICQTSQRSLIREQSTQALVSVEDGVLTIHERCSIAPARTFHAAVSLASTSSAMSKLA